MNEQIDQTALNLSRSIRKAEGGDYENRDGDAGTSAGAYQFNNGKVPLKKGEIPANFKSWAQEEGLNPDDFSQTNQDHVVYSRIKKKLDAGQSQSSIAAEWNSGLSKGWENHKGSTVINGKKIDYDTPDYVNRVKTEYERLTNGGSQEDRQSNGETFESVKKSAIEDTQTKPTDTTAPGNVIANLQKGKYGDAIQSGIRGLGNALTFGGTEQFAKPLGTSMAYFKEKAKGLVGGKDNSEFIPKTNNAEAFKGAGKIMAGSGLLTGTSVFSGARALEAPEIAYNIPIEMSKFAKLGKTQQLNVLGEALKKAGEGDKLIIGKAIDYLKPGASWLKSLLVKGGKELGRYITYNSIGDTASGLIGKMLK